MQQANGPLTSSLAAGQRSVSTTTRMAGKDVTGQVSGWEVDRSYSTDLPEAIRAVNGSAAAQLKLNLSGDGTATAAQLYSPYAPNLTADMARPKQSVTHGWGLNGETLPAFRGTVRSRSADSATGGAELVALDGAERLRDAARLPSTISTYDDPIASGVWVVDHLLRQAGIHSAPPPRDGCILYASMHGGVVPDIGFYNDHTSYGLTYTRAAVPWEMAPVPGYLPYECQWIPRTRATAPSRYTQFAEYWVDSTRITRTGGVVSLGLYYQADDKKNLLNLSVDFATGSITLNTTADGSGSAITFHDTGTQAEGRWHIGVEWGFNLGLQPIATVYLTGPGKANTLRTGPMQAVPDGGTQLYRVELVSALPVEAVQVSNWSGGDDALYDMFNQDQAVVWQRGAVLDDPLSLLHAIPPTQGSAWDVINAVAQAEQSTAEFDEFGVFRYRNNKRFAEADTPALTVTALREVAAVTVAEEIDSVRNVIDVPYSEYFTNGQSLRFTDTEVRLIEPLGSLSVTFTYDASEYDSVTPLVYADADNVPFGSSVRFAYQDNGAIARNGAVEVTTVRDGNTLTLTFFNISGSPAYTAMPDGSPSLQIYSVGLYQNKTFDYSSRWYADDPRSAKLYGAQVYQVAASPWIQRADVADSIAAYLLQMATWPLPTLGDVDVLPDPRIQLGDLVRVVDGYGAPLDTLAFVVGIRTSGDSAGQVRQTLTLRATNYAAIPTDTGLTPDPPLDPAAAAILAAQGIRVP